MQPEIRPEKEAPHPKLLNRVRRVARDIENANYISPGRCIQLKKEIEELDESTLLQVTTVDKNRLLVDRKLLLMPVAVRIARDPTPPEDPEKPHVWRHLEKFKNPQKRIGESKG